MSEKEKEQHSKVEENDDAISNEKEEIISELRAELALLIEKLEATTEKGKALKNLRNLRKQLEAEIEGDEVQDELSAFKTQLETVTEKNKSLEEQISSLKEGFSLSLAETENLRKRHKIELEKAGNDFISKFIGDMSEVFENFYRAREHADGGEDTIRLVADGIKMNIKIFEDTLRKHGIERIFPQKGDLYDYHKHQAISTLEDDAYAPNSILEVMRAGYMCKDLLIKPALVSVSKKAENV
ncbi:Protein GrpE [Candidatus Fokinia solitaria]|uniref:Protein GrpE n=1 Tax=Candidatus Fokinia solitaria TaxID=1802984 RepID=A0A2U8BSA3_9RICK|nr:nucleotide exchange factor GrpE [Candidatus Fokinia solitaria]AWD33234.1 Protein GrpE [Candidatus Fokinia solitaria]